MRRLAFAFCAVGLALAVHAQPAHGFQPEPPSFLTSPFTPMSYTPTGWESYVPVLGKSRDQYYVARFVQTDEKIGVTRDYVVLSQNVKPNSAFKDVLSQCVSNGDVSELLLNRVVHTSTATRVIKVINCSKDGLTGKAKELQLVRARQQLMARNALPNAEMRSAVYDAFADEITN